METTQKRCVSCGNQKSVEFADSLRLMVTMLGVSNVIETRCEHGASAIPIPIPQIVLRNDAPIAYGGRVSDAPPIDCAR
jgi:hypothetical protein